MSGGDVDERPRVSGGDVEERACNVAVGACDVKIEWLRVSRGRRDAAGNVAAEACDAKELEAS